MAEPVVAVDLGGTNMRAALFPEDSPHPSKVEKVPTQASEGPDAVLKRLLRTIETVAPKPSERIRVGVGVPAFLDPREGVVFEAPNLPGWKDVPLQRLLSDHLGCPVALGNDANLAALGEWKHGAGAGTNNLIYLTISTGIGGGIITDGRLLLGARGLAAELGHMAVQRESEPCGCGQVGHIEAIAAGPAIARRARALILEGAESALAEKVKQGRDLTAKDVGSAAQAEDRLARSVIEEAARTIGRHLASLVHALNPEVIVLGGGVSQTGRLLFEPLVDAMRSHVMNPAYLDGLRVVPAGLGDDAGLVGAMVLAREI